MSATKVQLHKKYVSPSHISTKLHLRQSEIPICIKLYCICHFTAALFCELPTLSLAYVERVRQRTKQQIPCKEGTEWLSMATMMILMN